MYSSLSEKSQYFANGTDSSFIINTQDEFLDTFSKLHAFINPNNKIPQFIINLMQSRETVDHESFKFDKEATGKIMYDMVQKGMIKANTSEVYYRGLSEAKYSLLTSGQRNFKKQNGISYDKFILGGLDKLKNHQLMQRILELEPSDNYTKLLGLLSLIQHYGGYTTLLDFTIDLNVALFFATESLSFNWQSIDIKKSNRPIEEYFSIYQITRTPLHNASKANFKKETIDIKSVKTLANQMFSGWDGLNDIHEPVLVSDFVKKDYSKPLTSHNVRLRTSNRFITMYNQYILPQLGVFFVNLHESNSLETIFSQSKNAISSQLTLDLACFNIHKSLGNFILSNYISPNNINKGFLFPVLASEVELLFKGT